MPGFLRVAGAAGLFPLLLLFSCAHQEPVRTTVTTGGPDVSRAVSYTGPRARIAVGDFGVRAARAGSEIGPGVSDMLVTALFQSDRFIVLERGQSLGAVKQEVDLAGSGYVNPDAAPEKGGWEGADILLMGAVTAFEPKASGSRGGGIFLPLPARVGGGIRLERDEAYIAADLRLVDTRTSRIVNTTRVEGRSSSFRFGGLAGALLGRVVLGGAWETYRNTPMEQAVMVMLDNAVAEIARLVPENYYRHPGTGHD